SQPLLIGFCIASARHVAAVRPHGDAVVVASAIADMLTSTPADLWESTLREFVAGLRAACDLPSGHA
ncbi:MAG: hypothetical protein HW416_1910, partial [Chloroflexi bacterium]|nr:hypothetical protein [Chloroflexota bacterium]